MFDGNKLSAVLILSTLTLISSCAGLKLNPPGEGVSTILVLPVQVENKTERTSRHGFYYIYQIISDPDEEVSVDSRVVPYEAVIKLPRKGNMLIVDALPPGDYVMDQFMFKTVGAGDFTYGQNAFPRNDRFTLQAGKITIFDLSLKVVLYNKIPGRGADTSYSFDLVSVSFEQRQEIMQTLKSLPNFESWEMAGTAESKVARGTDGSPSSMLASNRYASPLTQKPGNGDSRGNARLPGRFD